jgi:hypothetical protein
MRQLLGAQPDELARGLSKIAEHPEISKFYHALPEPMLMPMIN